MRVEKTKRIQIEMTLSGYELVNKLYFSVHLSYYSYPGFCFQFGLRSNSVRGIGAR